MSTAAPPTEELTEAVELAVGEGFKFGPDKTVPIHIIRPGIGKGRGRHLYEARMLQENASKFAGWKMYVDHRSREAQKAAGGLPRGVRDLGGRVLEAYWDPTVPADPERGFGQGAVVGTVRPVKWLREMIEDDPELVETSISAQATGVRPVQRDGQRVILVEGIADKGSVDWVTEAGAGGRVAPRLEEAYSDETDVELALLESMTDDEVREHLAAMRPGIKLQEAASEDDAAADGAGEGEQPAAPDESPEDASGETETDEGEPAGENAGEGQDPATETTEVAESVTSDPDEGGDDMGNLTPEALTEALKQSTEVQDFVAGLVEAKLEEGREQVLAEARAEAQRDLRLQRLEVEAHRLVEASDLPTKWRASVREMFSLNEAGEPTDALDVVDEIDEFGNVVKSASDVLKEAVDEELSRQRELLAEANPTRVRGQGRTTSAPAAPQKASETGWGQYLQESAGIDPDRAFAIQGAGDDA